MTFFFEIVTVDFAPALAHAAPIFTVAPVEVAVAPDDAEVDTFSVPLLILKFISLWFADVAK